MKNKSQQKTFELIAKTFFGLEQVLADELKILGAAKITIHNRAVSFEADNEVMYKSNYHLRTALRILKPILIFKSITPNNLYKNVKKYEWEKLFNVNETFAIDSVVSSEHFKHSKFVALKVKDAIVDRFRDREHERPSVDVNNPKIRINVHIAGDKCTISMDSSGDSLHKRGYRVAQTTAPLNEALAAGMILLSGWDRKSEFIDPMCGSGTIPIEAALIAHEIPPGYLREGYGFFKWNDFDEKLWEKIKAEVKRKNKLDFKIIASDKSIYAIEPAQKNIEQAGLSKSISVMKKYFDELKPEDDNGTIIMNPPYGERLKEDDLNDFYKMIGDTLKTNFTGFDAWMLSANKDAMKHIGLRTSKRLTLFNGALECKFHKYSLYKGSKKKG